MSSYRFKTVTTINGIRVPQSRAKVSVFDNALLYAEGLFETFLAFDDRVVFLEEHLDRLQKGAAVIGLKLPVGRKRLSQWMIATVKAHPGRVKKLRLTITSGEAARWVGIQGKPQVILSVSPHSLPRKPYRLLVSDWKVDHKSEFRRIKTISYAIHAAAVKMAKKKRFDDALLLNQKKEVAEVTTANIFWVKRGKIYTPPLSAGCLDGITRTRIIKEAKELGLDVIEQTDQLPGIFTADEIFISSSLRLVANVSQITCSQGRYSFDPRGEIATLLKARLKQLVLG